MSTYDASKNTSADDLAVILLNSPVKTNKYVNIAVPSTISAVDFYVREDLFTCGFGDTDNFRNRTKKLRCTTLRVVPVAECFTPPIPGTICTKNVDGRNVCGGKIYFFTFLITTNQRSLNFQVILAIQLTQTLQEAFEPSVLCLSTPIHDQTRVVKMDIMSF